MKIIPLGTGQQSPLWPSGGTNMATLYYMSENIILNNLNISSIPQDGTVLGGVVMVMVQKYILENYWWNYHKIEKLSLNCDNFKMITKIRNDHNIFVIISQFSDNFSSLR